MNAYGLLSRRWNHLPMTSFFIVRDYFYEERTFALVPEIASYLPLRQFVGSALPADTPPETLAALAALAPQDELAARTLLQVLLPGLVQFMKTSTRADPDTVTAVIGLAWERIRTYPSNRQGSVAANVVLDVRKRLWADWGMRSPVPVKMEAIEPVVEMVPPPEDEAINRVLMGQLAAICRAGAVNDENLRMVVQTRWAGIPLKEFAAAERVGFRAMLQRRWRTEQRLGQLLRTA
jgi:hypothetical protein